MRLREVGDVGQCEAHDIVQTEDDGVDVRCTNHGRCIREDMGEGRMRLRIVCDIHGLASYYEVN
jgi:hypothetical protein